MRPTILSSIFGNFFASFFNPKGGKIGRTEGPDPVSLFMDPKICLVILIIKDNWGERKKQGLMLYNVRVHCRTHFEGWLVYVGCDAQLCEQRVLRTERIQWFINDQALLANCPSFTVFLWIAVPAHWRERGEGGPGAGMEPNLTTERKLSLGLYKSFNPLWVRIYSHTYNDTPTVTSTAPPFSWDR